MASIRFDGFMLEQNREVIPVTSERPTADGNWRATDINGHEHRYEHGYPTLDFIVDREHWCMGNEGLYAHDPHMAVDESHYECKLCHVVVEPGQHPPFRTTLVPGMVTSVLTGQTQPGLTVKMYATEDEIAELLAAEDRDATARRILSEAPQQRIISQEFHP